MTKSNFPASILSATTPAGATVIDAVCTDKYPLGAVLVRFDATGLYALVSAGAVSSCDQREAENYVKGLEAKK